jgi:hypothetical protein
MIELLKHMNYQPPLIKPGVYGNMEIVDQNGVYYLYVDGLQWMSYNTKTHEDAYSVYGHYLLAEGHVVVSGMGFGARENWLLTKPEVTKLTIIELNKSVIEYHRIVNSPFLHDPRTEIINIPAQHYNSKCDVLLLDHYETESMEWMIGDAKMIHDAVDCKTFWFWPFERIIMHSRKWMIDRDPTGVLYTKHDAFCMLKKHHQLIKMPNFDPETIDLLCMMHHSTIFSRSELFLKRNCSDRGYSHNIYVSV